MAGKKPATEQTATCTASSVVWIRTGMIVKHKQFFFIFCTTATKIPFLPHFQTLQMIEYGPLKFFPHIPFENIHFYVPQNEKKLKLIFWTVWLIFSWKSHM